MIVVTGGSGFVGSSLVEKLVTEGHDVINADISFPHRKQGAFKEYWIRTDILSPFEVTNVLRQADMVYHLTANPSIDTAEKDPVFNETLNTIGTLNVLNASLKYGLRLLFVSTAQVYGEPQYSPIDETHPKNPKSNYAISKLAAEYYCKHYASKGLDVRIVRPFNIYGPAQKRGYVVPDFVQKLSQNPSKLEIRGTGEETRDFTFVTDIAEALATVMEKGRPNSIYNIGSGTAIKIKRLAKIIVGTMGLASEIVTAKKEVGKIDSTGIPVTADITKVRDLGWSPKVSLEEGIKLCLSFPN